MAGGGLALLLAWGSSQSKESDERIEAKLDRLLEERGVDPDEETRKVNESSECPKASTGAGSATR